LAVKECLIMDSENSNSSDTKQSHPGDFVPSTSVREAMCHYDTKRAAKRFASKVPGTATDRREKKCVEKALDLANIPQGASVLDLPCGAGRLLPLLKKRGYKITGADVSASMVEEARHYAGSGGENCLDETDDLVVANIFQTGFNDNRFDAVICHRLFQYFPDSQERRQALKELRRICSGPIIVSFLCNWAVDAIPFYIKKVIFGRKARGCMPISCATFAKDARESGLIVEKWIAMRPLISKRWYVILR